MQDIITHKEIAAFEHMLAAVDTAALNIAPYAQRYLQHIIDHRKYYCRIYARVLTYALCTPAAAVSPAGGSAMIISKEKCLVDYGAGNGVLGLMAKYIGISRVFINDINKDFLLAAEKLSHAMNIAVDGFVQGEVDALKNIERPDIIAGTDVIEHIYSLDHFFSTIKEINTSMVTVMTTASNPANPFKVRSLQKLQLKDELLGGSPDDHLLFGETAMEPFIETRRKIINAFSNELTTEEIHSLAIATRGLRKDDIEEAVRVYLMDRILPKVPAHPTNTCDPVTGSWSERLLSFEEYRSIYRNAGFEVTFQDGFYNAFEPGIKSNVLLLLNKLIPLAGHRLSPFIVLVGKAN